MNIERPRVATIFEQWNSLVIWVYVDVYIEDVHVLASKSVFRAVVPPIASISSAQGRKTALTHRDCSN
jgi:hypothetical protein